MLPTILDLVAACLIAINLKQWWAWLPVAAVVGAAIAVTYSLGLGVLGIIQPGQAFIDAIASAPKDAIFCAFCTWAFRGFSVKP